MRMSTLSTLFLILGLAACGPENNDLQVPDTGQTNGPDMSDDMGGPDE